jgi:polysaccharide export outer membrane protein
LQAGDVITSLFQPLHGTWATGKNEELNFEAQGISLAQALARAGGLTPDPVVLRACLSSDLSRRP